MNASGVADSCYFYRLTDLECDVNVLRTGLKDIEKVDILPAALLSVALYIAVKIINIINV